MLRIALILLCSAVILVSAAGNSGVSSIEVTSSPNPATNGTPEPITKKTTTSSEAPTTITTKATTMTAKPPTTTAAPSTTTAAPSTTTAAPSTTTAAPPTTSTTSGPPTTKAPPTPVPLETGKWSLNGTNEVCIVVQMAVQFEIMYHLNNTNKTTSQKLNLPVKNVTVFGSCDPKEQTLILSWNSTLGSDNDSLIIHFIKNDSTKKYTLHQLELVILPQELPNYNSTSNKTLKYVHMQDEFHTGLSNSYRCVNPPKFNLTSEGSNVKVGTVHLSNVQFQAFRSDKTTNFGLAEDCLTDTPDVVPIAVGCALAVLVVIVLVAYLIGRRRAQARGYLSM